jgi:hypothetical protein
MVNVVTDDARPFAAGKAIANGKASAKSLFFNGPNGLLTKD